MEAKDTENEIVAFFETCLTAAREGRVLFVAGAVGIVSGPPTCLHPEILTVGPHGRCSSCGRRGPFHETSVRPRFVGPLADAWKDAVDTHGPAPRRYGVTAASLVGPLAAELGPRERRSAAGEVTGAAAQAAIALISSEEKRADAALPGEEQVS